MTGAGNISDKSIGEIVAEDYRTAQVFENHGIDYCCGGNVSLQAGCREKGIDPAIIAEEIEAVKKDQIDRSQDYTSWDLSFLIDYIINVHHTYIKENTGPITGYTRKIASVHGAHHPEVIEIASIFDKIAGDLMDHLKTEEEEFFPALKRIEAAGKAGSAPSADDTEKVRNSLENLVQEHEVVGDAVHKIRHLAKGYAIPDDVCNTFTVTYQKLKEFEDDLHKHVHLENNILFLKAMQL
ncbi:iron-sulfur cluster repair di-iron protein [Desulfocastanea catecholica]